MEQKISHVSQDIFTLHIQDLKSNMKGSTLRYVPLFLINIIQPVYNVKFIWQIYVDKTNVLWTSCILLYLN